jgi:hypothetical protein
MDFLDSPEDAAFRSKVRTWLEENCTSLEGSLQALVFSSGGPDQIKFAR